MSQWLRALVALAEDPHGNGNFSSRGSDTLRTSGDSVCTWYTSLYIDKVKK